jgi:hypothetical protein
MIGLADFWRKTTWRIFRQNKPLIVLYFLWRWRAWREFIRVSISASKSKACERLADWRIVSPKGEAGATLSARRHPFRLAHAAISGGVGMWVLIVILAGQPVPGVAFHDFADRGACDVARAYLVKWGMEARCTPIATPSP